MVTDLYSQKNVQKARDVIEKAGLRFETNYDILIGIFEGDELVATGARDKNILKMLAIAPEHQGESYLGVLVTELVRIGFEAGYDTFFIYTHPQHSASFQALNFSPLVYHQNATLLEYGNGLKRYLESYRDLRRDGLNGAVVVNCNPFTFGHRYLIEKAAAQVDNLYVFVVREDKSVFPFDVRYKLVCEGVKDLKNVHVLDSSYYAVSNMTFPAYFLKESDEATQIQMEIDLTLFAKKIAPFFDIKKRFVGTEPYCRTTRTYSSIMLELLPRYGVEAHQVERIQSGDAVVSAFRVREALRKEAYETVRKLVPPSTLDYILSAEAQPLREKLRSHNRRH